MRPSFWFLGYVLLFYPFFLKSEHFSFGRTLICHTYYMWFHFFMKETLYNLTWYHLSFLVNKSQKSKFTVLVKHTRFKYPIVGKHPSYYVFHLCSFQIILLTTNTECPIDILTTSDSILQFLKSHTSKTKTYFLKTLWKNLSDCTLNLTKLNWKYF